MYMLSRPPCLFPQPCLQHHTSTQYSNTFNTTSILYYVKSTIFHLSATILPHYYNNNPTIPNLPYILFKLTLLLQILITIIHFPVATRRPASRGPPVARACQPKPSSMCSSTKSTLPRNHKFTFPK